MVGFAWRTRASISDSGRKGRAAGVSKKLIFVPPVILAALFGAAFWLTSRTTGLSRAVGEKVADDLRAQAWPTVQSIIETHWLFGTGFGSFPAVYKIFEPDSLLNDRYFNHAHNDWAEVLLTGGVPFACLLLIALVWFGRRLIALGTRNLLKGQRGDLRLAVGTIVLILAAASFVDYPLRVPSLQAMAVVLIILLCCPKPAKRPGNMA
ncbi:MAG: O-antigen ligase family protein [Sphingopyxis sp.]